MRVSVLIAAYNASWCIETAVDSALTQTEPPLEVVVCDDGSTDGTADLVERRFGDAVRVLRLPHGGATAARMAGAARAEGDWFALLDADDRWHPGKLARQRAWLAAHPDVRFVCTDGRYVASDGVVRASWLSDYFDTVQDVAGDLLPYLIERSFPLVSSALIERTAWEAVGGFDPMLAYSQDYDLWIKLAARFPGGVMPDVLVDYWTGPGTLSRDLEARWRDNHYIMHRVATGAVVVPPALRRRARERAAGLAFDLAIAAVRAGRFREARAHLREAARCGPWRRRVVATGGALLPRGWTRRLMRSSWARQSVVRVRELPLRMRLDVGEPVA